MPPGKLLVIVGLALVLIGLVLWFGPRVPWLGKLPGDIHIEYGKLHFYFPLGTSLLISLLLSLLFWLFRR